MTVRASVTVSPSSSRMMRSTPCVDGCCGPMFTTIRSSWIGSPEPPRTLSQSPPVTLKTRPSVVSRASAYASVLNCASYGSRLRGSQARSSRSSAPLGIALRGSQARSSRSPVSPPFIRRRDLRALVLDRDAAQRVVLALRVALPVVRHEDPGQPRVAVEDDAEHVVRLPLLPVGRRVDLG